MSLHKLGKMKKGGNFNFALDQSEDSTHCIAPKCVYFKGREWATFGCTVNGDVARYIWRDIWLLLKVVNMFSIMLMIRKGRSYPS